MTPSWEPRQRLPWWLWRIACTVRRRHFGYPFNATGWSYCRCSRPLPYDKDTT